MNHGGAPLDRESTGVLLRRVREGSLGALDELFARLRRSVRRWSANWLRGKSGHRGESTDIVELVVSRALPRIQGYDPRHRDALREYLRGAVRERAGEDLRFFEGLRESATADGDAPVAEHGDTPAAVQKERDERLERAVAALSSAEQELLVARFGLQLTFEQIGLATDLSGPAAARRAVARAVGQLGRAMELA